jgi:hypothetical protein
MTKKTYKLNVQIHTAEFIEQIKKVEQAAQHLKDEIAKLNNMAPRMTVDEEAE